MNGAVRKAMYYFAMGPGYWSWMAREASNMRRRAAPEYLNCFSGDGLEVGGRSEVFESPGVFPIYEVCKTLDNVVFGHKTAWEGDVSVGRTFRFHTDKVPGHQYVMEACALRQLAAERYDFVASSHMLEHAANPIAALLEWKRVLKTNGLLLLVLPHKDGTFDHRRPVTKIEHLIEDYTKGVEESDDTHFAEILAHHDLWRDVAQPSRASFEQWIRDNYTNRGAHHHVFDMRLAIQTVDYAGYQVLDVNAVRPFHIVLVAAKPADEVHRHNSAFLQLDSDSYRHSPFKTDRAAWKLRAASAVSAA